MITTKSPSLAFCATTPLNRSWLPCAGIWPWTPISEGLDDHDGQLYPLLVPDNGNSRLPGGDVVSLRRTMQGFSESGERYEWELFARKDWVDDSMLHLRNLLDLVAPHIAQRGYGGYFRDVYGNAVTVFTFQDGKYEPFEIWGDMTLR